MTDDAAARAREIRLKYPMIYFVGTSRGGNGNEAKVKGTVRMTPEGYIRWRFVSVCFDFPCALKVERWGYSAARAPAPLLSSPPLVPTCVN